MDRSTPVAELPPEVAALVPAELDGQVVAVFAGSLLALFRELGYPSTATYYHRRNELERMGCLRRLRPGTSHVLGLWALLHPPTEDLWRALVGRPFTRRREHEYRQLHDRRLALFLTTLASRRPELLGELVRAGCRSPLSVLHYLAELPERHLRARFGTELCLGYDLDGAPHTCGVAELDPLAPSTASGAYKRRADHAAALRVE